MFLGVVGNPPDGVSESQAYRKLAWLLNNALARSHGLSLVVGGPQVTQILDDLNHDLERAESLLKRLSEQVARGVHVNGRKRKAIQTSEDVLAIVYRHRDNDEFYVHGFGDAELDLSSRGDELRIRGLKDRTGIQMFAEPDGTVTIAHPQGHSIWEDMPE